jgi:hypothetical protein
LNTITDGFLFSAPENETEVILAVFLFAAKTPVVIVLTYPASNTALSDYNIHKFPTFSGLFLIRVYFNTVF